MQHKVHDYIRNINSLRLTIVILVCVHILTLSGCKPEPASKINDLAIEKLKDTLIAEVWLQDTSFLKIVDGSYILPWSYMLNTKLEKAYSDTLGMDVSLPLFSDTLQWLNHKIVTVEGFYIPVDETGDADIVVLSAFPFSQCFFCGKAGVESIIDVMPSEKLGSIKMDQKIKMRGRLKLNREDFNYLIFMLEDAVLVRK